MSGCYARLKRRHRSAVRTIITRIIVGVATVLLLGTILVGIVPDTLPVLLPQPTAVPTPTPLPAPDLDIREQEVVLSHPLAEGIPFTATVTVHNLGELAAERVQVLFSIVRATATGEQNIVVGSATAGPIEAHTALVIPVLIPPVVALVPGQYRYHASTSITRGPLDRDLHNNSAPVGIFAIAPPLNHCLGVTDLVLTQADVVIQGQAVSITVHNEGSRTLYNVQVLVRPLDGTSNSAHFYHLARILPCGGTATVAAFRSASKLLIEVNPVTAPEVIPEADHRNNSVIVDDVK